MLSLVTFVIGSAIKKQTTEVIKMTEIIAATWQLLGSLLSSVQGVILGLGSWIFSVLLILHNDMPRLEGLLLGILFAWFFVHREKNPFIRALAAPLKIVLDILDIVWDETVEAIADVWSMLKDKVLGVLGTARSFITGLFSTGVEKLKSLRDRLKKQSTEEQ